MGNSTGSKTKSIFSSSYKATYRTTLSLAPGFVAEMYDRLMQEEALTDLLSSNELINIKGRDKRQSLISSGHNIEANEILFAAGNLHNLAEKSETSFYVRCTTPYHKSTSKKVYHSISKQQSSTLPSFFDFKDAGRIIPAELSFFRLGFQKYAFRSVSSLFGLSGMVSASLCLDSSKDKLIIDLFDERLSKDDLPWANSSEFLAIQKVLMQVCEFDLAADLKEQLS